MRRFRHFTRVEALIAKGPELPPSLPLCTRDARAQLMSLLVLRGAEVRAADLIVALAFLEALTLLFQITQVVAKLVNTAVQLIAMVIAATFA